MKDYIVKPGQSLFDIAVIVYGSVEGLSWLIQDNNLQGPTDRIESGQKLKIRSQASNARARAYLEVYPVIATISEQEKTEGIGYWRVEDYLIQ